MIDPWTEWHRQLRETIARDSAALAAAMSREDLTRLCRESDFARKGAPVEAIVDSLVAGEPYILKQGFGGQDTALGLIKDNKAAKIYLGRLW